jgi:hypothetical protein
MLANKSNWIIKQDFNDIPQWDSATCLGYLVLSETSQQKLPGTNLTTSKVRYKIIEQLKSLIITDTDTKPEHTDATIENTEMLIEIVNLYQLLWQQIHLANSYLDDSVKSCSLIIPQITLSQLQTNENNIQVTLQRHRSALTSLFIQSKHTSLCSLFAPKTTPNLAPGTPV